MSVYRTIGPTLVYIMGMLSVLGSEARLFSISNSKPSATEVNVVHVGELIYTGFKDQYLLLVH